MVSLLEIDHIITICIIADGTLGGECKYQVQLENKISISTKLIRRGKHEKIIPKVANGVYYNFRKSLIYSGMMLAIFYTKCVVNNGLL